MLLRSSNAAVIIHNVQTNIYASGTRDVSIYAVQFAVGVHDVCVHDVCVRVYVCRYAGTCGNCLVTSRGKGAFRSGRVAAKYPEGVR